MLELILSGEIHWSRAWSILTTVGPVLVLILVLMACAVSAAIKNRRK